MPEDNTMNRKFNSADMLNQRDVRVGRDEVHFRVIKWINCKTLKDLAETPPDTV